MQIYQSDFIMQHQTKKIFYFIIGLTFAFFIPYPVRADNVDLIKEADTYFRQKKFKEALNYYEIALNDSIFYPDMFLKMAFISEGLGDYAQGLYYLNRYYILHPDQKIIKKMDELADKNRLKGYAITDENVFWTFYDKYYLYLVTSFFAIGGILFINLIAKLIRKDFISIQRNTGVIIILILYLFLINMRPVQKYIIIKNDNTYLMEAATSGCGVIQIINKGNRLAYTAKNDIWIQTEWEGKKAFINKKNIWEIEN